MRSERPANSACCSALAAMLRIASQLSDAGRYPECALRCAVGIAGGLNDCSPRHSEAVHVRAACAIWSAPPTVDDVGDRAFKGVASARSRRFARRPWHDVRHLSLLAFGFTSLWAAWPSQGLRRPPRRKPRSPRGLRPARRQLPHVDHRRAEQANTIVTASAWTITRAKSPLPMNTHSGAR